MGDERDFAIDDETLVPTAERADQPSGAKGTPEPPAPRVVIQYRNQGTHKALLPPLLVLLLALIITSYQRQARLRPLPPPASAAKGTSSSSGAGTAVEPVVVRTIDRIPEPLPFSDLPPLAGFPVPQQPQARPEPAREELARTRSEPEAGPFSPLKSLSEPHRDAGRPAALEPPRPLTSPVAEALSPDSPELAFRVVAAAPPAADPPAVGEQEPHVTKQMILQGIQVEAKQKQANQQQLELEVANSKLRELYEVIRKTQAERTAFHDELRRILIELRDDAGGEINALCERYGRQIHPDVHKMLIVTLNRSAASLKREAKIKVMRARGVPEAVILDYLAGELDNDRGKRGGPRDRNDVRVRAARLLLMYPPPAVPAAVARNPAGP